MKLRNPALIRLAAFLGAGMIRLWMNTVRCRTQLNGQHTDPNDPQTKGRFIYAFWHETLLFGAGWKSRAPIHALISQHADGELIARAAQHLGFDVIRGSSTRGSIEALRGMLRESRSSHLVVTPDGPRGPRRQVQPGVVYLASRTGLPIVPVGIGYQNAWRARSWDRFAVPKPWSEAIAVAGPITSVPPDIDRDELEHYRKLVEQRMLEATEAAERVWQ